MSDIGVEVGQKMRSAIKAKLMELECYVDDELPDYIMVMVANKRTKSQMNEDLQLFLGSKTATFVEWLHIVLKKLKEVHVTNPNVFNKKTGKRKIEDPELEKQIKKEKKDFKGKKQVKKEDEVKEKSLTDDLPMNISKLSESRKVILQIESTTADSFDIPTISEVNSSSEAELRMIERQIKSAKSRLGVVVDSGSDEEFLNIKAEPDDLFPNEQSSGKRLRKVNIVNNESLTPPIPATVEKQIEIERARNIPREHSRIIFDLDSTAPKKRSALERLGKRRGSEDEDSDFRGGKKKLKAVVKERNDKEKTDRKKASRKEDQLEIPKRESALLRLGVMSKVAVPVKKPPPEPVEEEVLPTKEVPSVVKVKPRVIPLNTPQANKNLLLKAVADAQRSIAQTPSVGAAGKPDALFTKKYKEKIVEKKVVKIATTKRKLPDKQKSKLQAIISHISKNVELTPKNRSTTPETEYVPKIIRKPEPVKTVEYTPSPKSEPIADKINFIITLDGIDKSKFEKIVEEKPTPPEKKRKSPIVFDKISSPTLKKIVANVPDVLPKVHAPPQLKNKERCKYWPACRQGEKCEFAHPSTVCKMFPQCKFGDKCLYVHPSCKFESSCTRRDCPYSHVSLSKSVASRITPSAPSMQNTKTSQVCKFYPNCTNSHCIFYHPRPCKFGKFCKNQLGCTFTHPKATNLTWRSDLKT